MSKVFKTSYGYAGGSSQTSAQRNKSIERMEKHESKAQEKKEHMADKMHKMLTDPKHLKNVAMGKAKEAYEKKHSVLD